MLKCLQAKQIKRKNYDIKTLIILDWEKTDISSLKDFISEIKTS